MHTPVNPNSDIPGPIAHALLKSNGATETPRDDVDFTGSTRLSRAMENVPAVRTDKVAKAKALVADPSYPSEATLSRVADVLTDHVEQPERLV